MPDTPSRRFLAGFAASVAAALAGIAGFNWAVDPFQFFHLPHFQKPVYYAGYQRYQNAGLARTQSYETVVIGTSVTENFLPSYINQSWGTRALKLSISGSTSYEQFLVLRQALRTGQVRHVIWALDAGAFYGKRERVRDDQAPFPYFMYRWPAWANVEYLYSLGTLNFSLRALKGFGETDLDQLETWHGKFEFSQSAALRAWGGDCKAFAQKYREGDSRPTDAQLAEMRVALERNLFNLIREHPEVRFHLFFAPVSTLTYVPAKTFFLPVLLPFKRAVLGALVDEPNVRLHDFQIADSITDDLNHYKDQVHFDLPVSKFVIDALRSERYRVRRSDIEPNIRRLIDQANRYDLCAGGMLPAARPPEPRG